MSHTEWPSEPISEDEAIALVKGILDEIKLSQVGWEDREDVMTFNGEPIGMTVSRNIEIDRWWPDLKRHLARYLALKLGGAEEDKP